MCKLNYILKNNEVWIGKHQAEALEKKQIFIPNQHKGMPVIGIEERAFWDCKIEEVIIEEGVKIIGEAAFANCRQLAQISIPESVTAIGSGAFEFCFKLRHIIMPERIAAIGWDMFEGCYNLRYVILPKNINEIEESGFWDAGKDWAPTHEAKEELDIGRRKVNIIRHHPDKEKIRDKENYGIKIWIPKSNFSDYMQELPPYSVLYYEGSEAEAAVEMEKYLNKGKVPLFEFYKYNVSKEEMINICKQL